VSTSIRDPNGAPQASTASFNSRIYEQGPADTTLAAGLVWTRHVLQYASPIAANALPESVRAGEHKEGVFTQHSSILKGLVRCDLEALGTARWLCS
jgi:hypothetical protein